MKLFGFKRGHSTKHAILSIVDKIQRAIDEKEFSCGIFLDFIKVFGTINHDILLKKSRDLWHMWYCQNLVYIESFKASADSLYE